MSRTPLDPPSRADDLVGIHDYTANRFREYDRAQAALGNLRAAYQKFGEALAEADAALENAQAYDPEEWYEQGRPIDPRDLRVPTRVRQYVTHDPELFLEADVMVGALARAMFELHDRVDMDRATIAREMRAAAKEVTE